MKPHEIKEGASYLLKPRLTPSKGVVRKVERIDEDQVFVKIDDVVKPFSLKIFADLAREEIRT